MHVKKPFNRRLFLRLAYVSANLVLCVCCFALILCTRTCIYICTHSRMHTCMHTCMHTHACTRTRTGTRTRTRTHTHTHTHTHVHAHVHAHAHTHAHTYAHTCTHIQGVLESSSSIKRALLPIIRALVFNKHTSVPYQKSLACTE